MAMSRSGEGRLTARSRNTAFLNVALYLGRRVLASAVAVVVLAVVVFLLMKAVPGDEAHVAAGPAATPAQVAAMRRQLGLDRPLIVQLGVFLNRLAHGNLGTSITTYAPVSRGIEQALPATIELVVLATILMIVITVPMAVFAALWRDRKRDLGTRFAVLVAAAIPTYWLALELQQELTVHMQIFPISGNISSQYNIPRVTGSIMLDSLIDGNVPAFWNAFQHLLLPAFVLMIPFGAALFRALRTEMIGVLGREHITVALAKGVPFYRLVLRHAMPNALGPALTVIGIEFGNMIGASVMVEAVFGLNGMGSFLTVAVANKDTFSVLGGVLVIGVIVVIVSLLVDILQLVRDPRLRSAQLGEAA